MRSKRGKWSVVSKAIKATYHKLPANVKTDQRISRDRYFAQQYRTLYWLDRKRNL